MTVDESLSLFGLVPSDESLDRIRLLLEVEAQLERAGEEREEDLALLCCVQLFACARNEDILRIWNAKQSGMDLGCYLDIELLCGSGLDETKRYLASLDTTDALEALQHIDECEAAGDFEGFAPNEYLKQHRAYFEAL